VRAIAPHPSLFEVRYDACADSFVLLRLRGCLARLRDDMVWTVKFDGPCSRCGTILEAGTEAVWDRRTRRMSCLECQSTSSISEPALIDAGTAGRSARTRHEQLLARREARLKADWGERVGGWLIALTDEPASTRAWATGALGEETLGRVLAELEAVEVLHDRGVPGRRSNIDHIVFAPAGIFVVDTKHYKGQVQIRRPGSFFRPDDRLYVGRWDCTKDVEAVKGQVAVVESILVVAAIDTKPPVTPVLCFTRADWPLFGAPKSFDGVYLESQRSIKKLVTASVDFSRNDMRRVRSFIAKRLPPR
jgi:hypothetical protein